MAHGVQAGCPPGGPAGVGERTFTGVPEDVLLLRNERHRLGSM